MPIIGLTDSRQAAFQRIGKLRKGGQAQRNQNGQVVRMGEDLPGYFRFTSDRPEIAKAFEEAYGDKPALLNVFLPYETIEENFSTWKEAWAAGGLIHRCDGQTMTIWQENGTYHHEPKPCDGGCKQVGRLSLWLPELLLAGFVGTVTLEVHGIHDLLSIQGSILAGLAMRHKLSGIQWTLTRRKETISTPNGKGGRVRRDKWLVKLEPEAEFVRFQIEAAHAQTLALPAPDPERPDNVNDDGEYIEAEAIPTDGPPWDDEGDPEHEAGYPPEPTQATFEPPMPDSHLCAACIKERRPATITEHQSSKRLWTADEITAETFRRYGDNLCWDHWQQIIKADQQAQA